MVQANELAAITPKAIMLERLKQYYKQLEEKEGIQIDSPEVVEGCDYVLHQAALGSVPRSIADPMTSTE